MASLCYLSHSHAGLSFLLLYVRWLRAGGLKGFREFSVMQKRPWMTDFENQWSKQGLVRGIYTGSNCSYSYSPEVHISPDSSSLTTQSNGKGEVKGEGKPFPVTNNSTCTVTGLGKTKKKKKAEAQFHNFPFLLEWITTFLYNPET